MASQCQAKCAATVGTQLLAKIHILHNKVVHLDQRQDHPTLGAEGVLPGRHIVSLLRVFEQFTPPYTQ